MAKFEGASTGTRPLPTCTVLVIAYRMRATIAESLRSILAQDVPCEIIVSDDSSGDGTLDVVEDVLRDYRGPHRISVRSTARNLGLCAHLNELAALATGEVLVFQAGDDVAYPHRVRRLLEAFAAHPQAQLVGSAVDDIDSQGRLLARRVRGMPARMDQRTFMHLGRLRAVLGASMALRREVFTSLPPLEGTIEDNMLTLRGALLGECRCLAEPLLAYRRHGGNLSNWMFDRGAHDWATYQRRNRRVLGIYREIASDQERCVQARPDLPAERRRDGLALARMYRLEADMREAFLDHPRRRWLRPLWHGLCHPGLRRKSVERGIKLLIPRRWFGRAVGLR